MCNRFRSRGLSQSGPTYICECCGKRTRETGEDEASLHICAACYWAGQVDILFWDYSPAFTETQVADFTARKNACNPDTPQADTKALKALFIEMAAIAHR
jgi:hypothetical protein